MILLCTLQRQFYKSFQYSGSLVRMNQCVGKQLKRHFLLKTDRHVLSGYCITGLNVSGTRRAARGETNL